MKASERVVIVSETTQNGQKREFFKYSKFSDSSYGSYGV